jgi:hypothetical protein
MPAARGAPSGAPRISASIWISLSQAELGARHCCRGARHVSRSAASAAREAASMVI